MIDEFSGEFMKMESYDGGSTSYGFSYGFAFGFLCGFSYGLKYGFSDGLAYENSVKNCRDPRFLQHLKKFILIQFLLK